MMMALITMMGEKVGGDENDDNNRKTTKLYEKKLKK